MFNDTEMKIQELKDREQDLQRREEKYAKMNLQTKREAMLVDMELDLLYDRMSGTNIEDSTKPHLNSDLNELVDLITHSVKLSQSADWYDL